MPFEPVMNLLDKSRSLYRLFAPGTHLPVYIMMYVTHRCDARCGHCFFWRELNTNQQDELTIDEIDKLARSIGPALQITLTGGSPELRNDLPEVAQSFYRRCTPPNMTICMNGYHTEKILSDVEKILLSCPDQQLTIGLSLDGIGEEHNRIRGMKGLFDRVIDTFDGLDKLKRKYGRLRPAVAIVVSGLNYQTAEKTALWARKNLPVDFLKIILVRGDPKFDKALNEESFQAAGNTYIRMVDDDRMQLAGGYHPGDSLHWLATTTKESIQRDMIKSIHQTGNSPVLCSASRENIVIHANGDVLGCELRSEKLGNLRDYDMKVEKLWRSESARAYRSRVRSEKCSCYHHCFLAPAIFRSPNQWPNVIRTAWNIWRTDPIQ